MSAHHEIDILAVIGLDVLSQGFYISSFEDLRRALKLGSRHLVTHNSSSSVKSWECCGSTVVARWRKDLTRPGVARRSCFISWRIGPESQCCERNDDYNAPVIHGYGSGIQRQVYLSASVMSSGRLDIWYRGSQIRLRRNFPV